jgi:ribonuclease HI
MSIKRKFYVVWNGYSPGVYDSWEECQRQTKGYPGARFKAFDYQDDAIAAFRGDPDEHTKIIKAIARHRQQQINYSAMPGIVADSIAVDAACSKNPGPMEYRGVDVTTGAQLFHVGPLADGTNNVGEYLALVHALSWLHRAGNSTTTVYSDSRTALSWLRRRGHASKLAHTPRNARVFELLARADAWIQSHPIVNPVVKWDTDNWGEIPADFGRK